ncbi:adenylate/guanylate cyclase domain-containing protein [Ilumatobacter nonamiensis]|uniref:adenylate/guanylate cyclase domain-containing protein n=1 Tax=Ilumatobacter nonamiensis TaxID=467093 RepID=UPI000349EC56|nr:adenylate/guanylate cyclase domain-containing protein [Ilumatobacter nonamiensis]
MACATCGEPGVTAADCPRCKIPSVTFCGQCGRSSAPEAAFCAGCGTRLDGSAPVDRVDRLGGQRRNVAIMMSDLSGYTAMGETLDPEIVHEVVGTIKRDGTAIVESHGGIVNQFVGDEIVALFGLPSAGEDDVRRAVHAALAIHARVTELSDELHEQLEVPLEMHTSVHAGLVVAELSDLRNGTYDLTGDAINTAARLLHVADRGEVVIGESTMTSIAPYFDLESAGLHAVRNKVEPLNAFRVIRPRANITRFDVARERGLTALAGRHDELARLDAVLDAVRTTPARIAVVQGTAGSGKSRLCFEFLDWARTENPRLTTVKGRCQAIGGTTAYLPFVEILRAHFGVGDRDDAETTEALVGIALAGLGEEVQRFAPAYLFLLSARVVENLPEGWRGEALPDVLQAAIVELLVALGREHPTVVQLEDWHWADDASRATLRRLVSSTDSNQVMVLVTTRDEHPDEHSWGEDDVLRLEPLGLDATRDMACAIARSESVDEPLLALIFERTLGNPLFVEELCTALDMQEKTRIVHGRLELSGSPDELVVPDTVQAVVQGRVDTLASAHRDMLRAASVIGREFRLDVLESLVDDAEFEQRVVELEQLGFVESMTGSSRTRCRFHHVTIQEVVYDALLIGARRRLHAQIADFIASSQSVEDARTQRNVEELAHHYRLANDPVLAVKYLSAAGAKATEQRALAEAQAQLHLAIEETYKLESSADVRAQRGHLTVSWARSCVFEPSVAQTRLLAAARDEALGDGNFELALLAAYWISWIHHSIGNQLVAEEGVRALIGPLEGAGQTSTLAMARCHLAQILGTQRRLDEALAAFEAGMSVRRDELTTDDGEWDLELLDGVYCYTISQHALVLGDRGDVAAARTEMNLAIELTRATGERATEASVLIVAAILETYTGEWDRMLESVAAIDTVPEPSVSPFVRMFAMSLEGYARFGLGQTETGLDLLRRSLELDARSEAQLAHSLRLALLADALLRSGHTAEAVVVALDATAGRAVADIVGVELAERVLLQAEQLDGAELTERIELLRRDALDRGSRRSLALAELAAAAALVDAGESARAAEHHQAARDLLDQLGLDGFATETESLGLRIRSTPSPRQTTSAS